MSDSHFLFCVEVNSELSYTFGQAVTFFHLDAPTGIVTSLETLDRETYTTGFTYKVVATDHGVVPRSGTATVQVSNKLSNCFHQCPQFCAQKIFEHRRKAPFLN